MTGRMASSGDLRDARRGYVHAASISNEPIVNFAFRWLVDIAFLLFVLSIIYMSFVPFDLTLTRPDRGWRAGRILLGLGTRPFNLPDILANILYYIPISTLGFFVLRRRMGWFAAPVAMLLLGSALSFGVEFAQQWTRTRVPVWADFAANVLGLLVGLALAIVVQPFVRLIARSGRDAISGDLPGAAAKLLVCLLLAIHVRPFDLAADVPRTVLNAARQGDFHPTARWTSLSTPWNAPASVKNGLPIPPTVRARHEYLMDLSAATAGYAALSWLIALSARRHGSGLSLATMVWCGFVTVSLAAIITTLRVLMMSHGLDTAHVLCGLGGWPLGVIAARRRSREKGADSAGQANESIQAGSTHLHFVNMGRWMPAASLLAGLWVILYELVPFDFAWAALSHAREFGRVTLLPMSGQFAGSIPNLVADLSGKFIRYAVLTACLVRPISAGSRMNWRGRSIVIAACATLVVALLQAVHLFQPSRTCDVTNVLIAAAAALASIVMLRGIRDVYGSSSRVVDDPLTRQLIDGESFDKNAISSLRRPRNGVSPMATAPMSPRD